MTLSCSQDWVLRVRAEPGAPPGEASALLAALRRVADHREGAPAGLAQPARAPIALQDAYRTCVAITREHSRSFFFSTQLLPPEKRRAIRALYAFCRTSDDLVDTGSADPARALAAWVAQVHAPQAPPDNAVLLAWKDTAARYAIPQSLTDELLAGIAMDLSVHRYATFEDLWLYCYRVASVVGLISMRIIGYQEPATSYAVKLGIALQMTNILRDVGEDARRGRVYLPQADLERFGLRDEDILSGLQRPADRASDERFRRLMRFEIGCANALYREARPGIALLSADGRLATAAAAEIYRGILGKVASNGYDVFTRRAYVPLAEKLLLLLRARRRLGALR